MEYDDFSRYSPGEKVRFQWGKGFKYAGKILHFSGRMLEPPDLHPFERP
jgi:hypothetical protein